MFFSAECSSIAAYTYSIYFTYFFSIEEIAQSIGPRLLLFPLFLLG